MGKWPPANPQRSSLSPNAIFYSKLSTMLIQEKIGNLASFPAAGRTVDPLSLEWYETSKRIMRKYTDGKLEVSLRFLNENPALAEGDVLYADDRTIIAI